MQSRFFLKALSAAALLAAVAAPLAASADEPAIHARATLAAPLAAPKSAVIGGLQWKCEGAACVATVADHEASWSAMYSCKKVAGEFGPLASFADGGVAMSSGNLGVCNKAASH